MSSGQVTYRDRAELAYRPLRCTRLTPNDDIVVWGGLLIAMTLLGAYALSTGRELGVQSAIAFVLWVVVFGLAARGLLRRLRWERVAIEVDLAEDALVIGERVHARVRVVGSRRPASVLLTLVDHAEKRGYVLGKIADAARDVHEVPLTVAAGFAGTDYALVAIVDDGRGDALEASFAVRVIPRDES